MAKISDYFVYTVYVKTTVYIEECQIYMTDTVDQIILMSSIFSRFLNKCIVYDLYE